MKDWLRRGLARAEPLWSRLLEAELLHRSLAAWQELPPRDQRALVWLATALAGAVLIFGLWRPLLHYGDQARSRHAQAQEDLAWMQSQRHQLVGGSQRVDRQGEDGSGQIAASARRHQLHLGSLHPLGKEGWSLRLDGAEFASVLNWLAELLQNGLSIDEFHARRADAEGTVDLQLVIRER